MTKIELKEKINELREQQKNFENAINECQKALAELKESKKEGKWKPDYGARYWFRCDNGDIDVDDWFDDAEDFWRYNNIPIFKTENECKRYWHFMDTVKEKSYEFSNLDWRDDDIVKWVIEYDYLCKQLRVGDHRYIKHFGLIYFKDKESAQFIIDNFSEELKEYWL